jgi:hypothetical protein
MRSVNKWNGFIQCDFLYYSKDEKTGKKWFMAERSTAWICFKWQETVACDEGPVIGCRRGVRLTAMICYVTILAQKVTKRQFKMASPKTHIVEITSQFCGCRPESKADGITDLGKR